MPEILQERMQQTVVLDYRGLLAAYQHHCLKYLSFSETYVYHFHCYCQYHH